MELDKKIAKIQRSTRTLFKAFSPLHDWLRLHSKFYYSWSLKPCTRVVHWAVLLLYICSLPAMFLSSFQSPQSTKASEVTYDFPRWEWVNPKPTGDRFTKVAKCEDGSLLAVGGGGGIMKSTDNGQTWKKQYSGIIDDLYDIGVINNNNILVVGGSHAGGAIIHYNGISWTRVVSNSDELFNSLAIIDQDHAIAVGQYGQITAITYSGSIWMASTIPASDPNVMLSNVTRIDSTHAIVMGTGKDVYLTLNGSSWNKTTIPNSPTATHHSYAVIDPTSILAVGWKGQIDFLKYDGSLWDVTNIRPEGLSGDTLVEIVQIDPTHALAVGSSSKSVALTYNGTSWIASDIVGALASGLFNIKTVDSSHALAVGASGRITSFTYDGSSWTAESINSGSNTKLVSLVVIDSTHAAAVGFDIVYMTKNDSSWSANALVNSDSTTNFKSVAAMDSTHALAVGDSNQISELTYDGSIWIHNTFTNDKSDGFASIVKVDSTHALAVEYGYGNILSLTKTSSSWDIEIIPQDMPWPFNSITVIDSTHAIAVGNAEQILSLSYDGSSWIATVIPYETEFGYNFESSTKMDSTHVLAASRDGKIIAISYSGSSWSVSDVVSHYDNYTFMSIASVDSTHAIVVGVDGDCRSASITYNGSTWESNIIHEENGVLCLLNNVIATDYTHAIAVGDAGKIVAFTLIGSSWSVEYIENDASENFLAADVISPTAAIASGCSGQIYTLLLDGSTWKASSSPAGTWSLLYAIVNLGSGHIITAGTDGNILAYTSPANATATKLSVSLPGQSFADETSPNISGSVSSARVGENYLVKTYAVDSSSSPKLDRGIAYNVALSSNDPKASNTAPFYLNNNIDETCNSGTETRIANPCGIGSSNIVFHTPGTWTVSANDAGGSGLASATSSPITVLPGTPHHSRFINSDDHSSIISSISSSAGIAKKVTLGLSD
ncbi:MAG: hypothetical protein WC444_07690, partial [Candidatus Paceibacterota bacterium]